MTKFYGIFVGLFSSRFRENHVFIRSTLFLFLRIIISFNAIYSVWLNVFFLDFEQNFFVVLCGLVMLIVAKTSVRPSKESFIRMFVLELVYIFIQLVP
jgi:hypothetical protein